MLRVILKQRGVYQVKSIKRQLVHVRNVHVVKKSYFGVFTVFQVKLPQRFRRNPRFHYAAYLVEENPAQLVRYEVRNALLLHNRPKRRIFHLREAEERTSSAGFSSTG